jgi:2,3-bisphosphoglycerate-dependent phosphoglycerate mutase
MKKIVLVRHGESLWNKENRFTGWTDVELSERGLQEAHEAGKILKKNGYEFDLAFTSVQKRAIKTLWVILEEMNLIHIPVIRDWHLNERHYGALTGLNKSETAEKHGKEQVHLWRRSYDIQPPALRPEDPNPAKDPRYNDLEPEEKPLTECLKDTVERFVPYWEKVIVPEIKSNKRIIISAHGNSLRALIKHIDNIPDKEIPNLEIPTGKPIVYELEDSLKPIKHYYL